MKVPLLLSLVLFPLGIWLGWSGGWDHEREVPRHASKTDRKPAEGEPSRSMPERTILEEARHIREMGSPKNRLEKALELAHAIPGDALGDWLKEGRFRSGDPLVDALFTRIVGDRLFLLDPETAVRNTDGYYAAESKDYGSIYIWDWLANDPEAATEYVLKNARGVAGWPYHLLKHLVAGDPDGASDYLGRLTTRVPADHSAHILSYLGPMLVSHRDDLLEQSKGWSAPWRRMLHVELAKSTWKAEPAETVRWLVEVETHPEAFLRVTRDLKQQHVDLQPYAELIPAHWLEQVVKGSRAW